MACGLLAAGWWYTHPPVPDIAVGARAGVAASGTYVHIGLYTPGLEGMQLTSAEVVSSGVTERGSQLTGATSGVQTHEVTVVATRAPGANFTASRPHEGPSATEVTLGEKGYRGLRIIVTSDRATEAHLTGLRLTYRDGIRPVSFEVPLDHRITFTEET